MMAGIDLRKEGEPVMRKLPEVHLRINLDSSQREKVSWFTNTETIILYDFCWINSKMQIVHGNDFSSW